MNFNGILIALATGLLIWFGHFWVVKLFQYGGTRFWFVPFIFGIIFIVLSLVVENVILSAIAAISSVTFFWGIKELFEYKAKHNQIK